ncbi:MAG: GNAT family N-acetyltransferase [Bacteroidales bacterium]|nr:GNAT family N-acetyltransferase [Bacteroidales bacterium]
MLETKRILLRPWRESDAAILFRWASDPLVGPRAGWPPHKSEQESLEVIRTVFSGPTNWAIVLKGEGLAGAGAQEGQAVTGTEGSAAGEPGGLDGAGEPGSEGMATAGVPEGMVVGAIGYGPACDCALPARDGEPICGYWVARPYWNRGICTEALRLMIDHIRSGNGATLPTAHDEISLATNAGTSPAACDAQVKESYAKDHSLSGPIKSLISGHFVDNPASGRVMEKCGFVHTGETVIDPGQFQGADRPIRVLRLEL